MSAAFAVEGAQVDDGQRRVEVGGGPVEALAVGFGGPARDSSGQPAGLVD